MCLPGEPLAWTKVCTSHSDISPASINVFSCATHLDAQDKLINKTHQLVRPRLCLSMMGLMVEVSDADGKSVEKLSKSQKIVKKSKNLKGLKSRKNHRFRRMFTKAPVLRQRRTRTSIKTLAVFRALFAGRRRSSLNTIFESIINRAKLMELLMLCRVFP